jgi:hypothetical protein
MSCGCNLKSYNSSPKLYACSFHKMIQRHEDSTFITYLSLQLPNGLQWNFVLSVYIKSCQGTLLLVCLSNTNLPLREAKILSISSEYDSQYNKSPHNKLWSSQKDPFYLK